MLNRLLVLHYEGAPRSWHITAGDLRAKIAACQPEEADALQVWAVFQGGEHPAYEVTDAYAADIARLATVEPIPDFLPLARAM